MTILPRHVRKKEERKSVNVELHCKGRVMTKKAHGTLAESAKVGLLQVKSAAMADKYAVCRVEQTVGQRVIGVGVPAI